MPEARSARCGPCLCRGSMFIHGIMAEANEGPGNSESSPWGEHQRAFPIWLRTMRGSNESAPGHKRLEDFIISYHRRRWKSVCLFIHESCLTKCWREHIWLDRFKGGLLSVLEWMKMMLSPLSTSYPWPIDISQLHYLALPSMPDCTFPFLPWTLKLCFHISPLL